MLHPSAKVVVAVLRRERSGWAERLEWEREVDFLAKL